MTTDWTEQLVNDVAKKYKRDSWWADMDDLRQTGHLALIRARETFDSAVGVPADAYFRTAIASAMVRVLWEDSSPVSGGKHRPREAYAGLQRASLIQEDGEFRPFASNARPADVALDEGYWRANVRRSLIELADGDESLVAGLLGEATAEEIAEERPRQSIFVHRHCVVMRKHDRVEEVRCELAKLRARARIDEPLYKLARERKD